MTPKRRSLRERDQSAIAELPEVLAGQTAIDLPEPPEAEAPQGFSGPQAVPVGPTVSTGVPAPQRGPGGAGKSARRLGIYFHTADFANAKAAYLADWQGGGNADTFAKWIASVLTDHAKLSPIQRAGAALPPRQSGSGFTRSFALPQAIHDTVRAAVIADQETGRWVTASMWAGAALHAAAQAAKKRTGESLPAPPVRLPNRLFH